MFLKLTATSNGKPQFINMDYVEGLISEPDGGCVLYWDGESCSLRVKESPDEIMMLMATGTLNVDTR